MCEPINVCPQLIDLQIKIVEKRFINKKKKQILTKHVIHNFKLKNVQKELITFYNRYTEITLGYPIAQNQLLYNLIINKTLPLYTPYCSHLKRY